MVTKVWPLTDHQNLFQNGVRDTGRPVQSHVTLIRSWIVMNPTYPYQENHPGLRANHRATPRSGRPTVRTDGPLSVLTGQKGTLRPGKEEHRILERLCLLERWGLLVTAAFFVTSDLESMKSRWEPYTMWHYVQIIISDLIISEICREKLPYPYNGKMFLDMYRQYIYIYILLIYIIK